MGLFRKRKQPNPKDLARIDTKERIVTSEAEDSMRMGEGVAFDYQVIEDENILGMLHPASTYHLEWLEELAPLFSRLNFLSRCNSHEADLFKMMVDRAITRLKYRRKSREEKMLLNNLRTYFFMRINDSVEGWKLNVLTLHRRELRIREEQERKRGILNR